MDAVGLLLLRHHGAGGNQTAVFGGGQIGAAQTDIAPLGIPLVVIAAPRVAFGLV